MTKTLILVTGQKGGVAKTLTAALLLSRLRNASALTVAGYDADGTIGGLQRHLGLRGTDAKLLENQDPHTGVVGYNIHVPAERDMLLDSLALGSEIVLHDLAGGSLDDLLAVVDGSSGRLDNFFEAVSDCGYRTFLVHLVTTDVASWHSLSVFLDNSGGFDVSHLAVVNRHFGGEQAYGLWMQSQTRGRLFAAGGQEVSLPAFPVQVLDKIKSSRISYELAATSGPLTITERANFRRCKREFDGQIDPILGQLGVVP